MTVYLDTSAAAKLLVEEPESAALASYLDELETGESLASSALLETELRRLAVRLELSQAAVTDVLDQVDLLEPNRSLFHEAGLLPGDQLRSLDALHLATVVRFDARHLVAYDRRLLAAASTLGIATRSP